MKLVSINSTSGEGSGELSSPLTTTPKTLFPLIPLPVKEAVAMAIVCRRFAKSEFPLIPLPVKEAVWFTL